MKPKPPVKPPQPEPEGAATKYFYKQVIPVSDPSKPNNSFDVLIRGYGSTTYTLQPADINRRISGPLAQDVPTTVAIDESYFQPMQQPSVANDPKTPASASGFAWTQQSVDFKKQFFLVTTGANQDVFWIPAANVNNGDLTWDYGPNFGWRFTLSLPAFASVSNLIFKGLQTATPGIVQQDYDNLHNTEVILLERAWVAGYNAKTYRLSPFFWSHMDPHRWPVAWTQWPESNTATSLTVYLAVNLHPMAEVL